MSMIMKQWNNATVTPKDDAVLYDVATGRQAGIVTGCALTHIGSNQVRVAEGYILIRGRLIAVEQEVVNVALGKSGDIGRIKVVMNLGGSEPVVFGSDAGAELPDLVQDADVNITNGIYEMELGTYSASEETISNLQRTAETVALPLGLIRSTEELEAVTIEGMAVDAKVIKEIARKTGTVLKNISIAEGQTSKVVENENIMQTSLIDVYYAEGSKETVQTAKVSYDQTEGKLTIRFESALAAAVTIDGIRIVNP